MADVAVVTRDLMDGGRFRAARPDVVVVRSIDDERLLAADIVVVDLAVGPDLASAVARFTRVIAYGPHVDTDALDAALAAGCEDAVPRSVVFRRIAELA